MPIRFRYDGLLIPRGRPRVWGVLGMNLPNGAELAWFLCGMWAALFILRAARSTHAGFFAVVALLVVAIAPAAGMLYERQLNEFVKRVQQVVHNR
jgi:hypothetical protein